MNKIEFLEEDDFKIHEFLLFTSIRLKDHVLIGRPQFSLSSLLIYFCFITTTHMLSDGFYLPSHKIGLLSN